LAACFVLAVGAAVLLNYQRQKNSSIETTAKQIVSPKATETRATPTNNAVQIDDQPSATDSQIASLDAAVKERAENKNASVGVKTRGLANASAPPRDAAKRKPETVASATSAAISATASASTNSSRPMMPVAVMPREVNQSSNFSATAAPPVVKAASTATDLPNVNSSAFWNYSAAAACKKLRA
jgi:hypothetical protein